MVYLYHPSRGSEDRTRNNTIRQWMATRSLIRVWQQRGSNELLQTVRKNIDYNLKTMYAEEGELGLILETEQGQAGRRRPGRTGAHRVTVRRRVCVGPRPPRNDRRLALGAGRRVPHLLPTGRAE